MRYYLQPYQPFSSDQTARADFFQLANDDDDNDYDDESLMMLMMMMIMMVLSRFLPLPGW